MITLFDFLRMSENDYDTYDTKYDMTVTVCWIGGKETDDYDRFCNGIIKKVNVVKIDGDYLVVNWSEFIERNIEEFKTFTNKHWKNNYENDIDELIYQWIREIHYYIAGYVDDDFYKTLINFINNLK